MDRYLLQHASREVDHSLIPHAALSVMDHYLLQHPSPEGDIASVSRIARSSQISFNTENKLFKRIPKKSAYPAPARRHGGKHLRQTAMLAQPGGRRRCKDRRAPRKH